MTHSNTAKINPASHRTLRWCLVITASLALLGMILFLCLASPSPLAVMMVIAGAGLIVIATARALIHG
jgi:CHASE2 domain-containing sensor protein